MVQQRVAHSAAGGDDGMPAAAAAAAAAAPGPRRSRRKFGVVDALLSEEKGPLDDEEQEQLIREFEQLHLEQTRTYRTMFGGVGLLLAAFFAWAISSQHTHPFGQIYTGELHAVLESSMQVQAMFAVQALSLGACCLALLRQLPAKGQRERGCLPPSAQQRLLLQLALVGSSCCCAFWLLAYVQMLQRFGWALRPRAEVLWVPLGPLSYVGMCAWVVGSLASSGSEVAAVRAAKYNLKTA